MVSKECFERERKDVWQYLNDLSNHIKKIENKIDTLVYKPPLFPMEKKK